MKKCLFLIPTTYNDGKPVPSKVMLDVWDELFVTFGPFSQDGVTEGLWEMKDGTRIKDHSLKIWIVIEEEKVPLLKELIKKIARLLEQETIYFDMMVATWN